MFVWNICTHKTFILPVFELFKLFRSSFAKSIQKTVVFELPAITLLLITNMLLRKVFFLIRNKDSSRIREAGNTNKSIFMLIINFRLIQVLSL